MTSPPPGPSSRDLPGNIENLLHGNRLKRAVATPESIAALWQKAVERAQDSELLGMSIDGSLQAAYDAGHAAALALLAVHDLRTGSGPGHHEVAFSAAASLGGEELADLVPDSSEIRGLRHASVYDPQMATPEDRDHALEWMRRTLPALRRAILAKSRSLSGRLVNYPPKRPDLKP